MVNRKDIIIKNKREKRRLLIDGAIPPYRYVRRKEAQKKLKYSSLFGDTTEVVHEMCDYTGNNWSHRDCNRRFTEKCGGHTRRTS